MRAIQISQPASLQNLRLAELAEPPAPGKGEITVRLHATSLNYHDYAVVIGAIKTPEGRIPMSDGAGVVEAVGEGVTEFAVGDPVVSTFFPDWLDGDIPDRGFTRVPGDGERVTAEATAFTRVPAGYSHAEAATLTCAGVTAWRALVPNGNLKAGETVLVQGSGGVSVFALQFA